jgi:hypothetical protein
VVFAAYTNGGYTMDIASAYPYISPYFDGQYFTGQSPPFYYPFVPYSAVVDMEDGTVIAMDTSTSYLSTTDILNAVQSANSD